MAIRVLSFDFDGCLFNQNYIKSENKDVIIHNLPFLDKIKTENSEFEHVTCFVGSNRQSLNTDNINLFRKGSCFPAIAAVSAYLRASLDTFLLADIYGRLDGGTSYQRITSNYTEEHSDWQIDDTKLTILYAQMHKIANEYPDEAIVFDFFDDRRHRPAVMFAGKVLKRQSDDILEHVNNFFIRYPDLIPANVTLRLNHYNGFDVTAVANCQGTGMIDANFRETVIEMTNEVIKSEYNESGEIIDKDVHVTQYLVPELLKSRVEVTPPIRHCA